MKVCLFDIDGTLLNTGGAGQSAMEAVLKIEFGIENLEVNIPTAGRTDRAIISDLFKDLDIEQTEENWSLFRDAYLKLLPEEMGDNTSRLLPGVCELLEELSALENVHLGLLTGNFQTGAWAKLSHFGIDHHFNFGGFGDHHHNRDDVARTAFEKTNEHLGLEKMISANAIWVIGDTPADVQCSRAIGANAIAVATGMYDSKTLEEAKPDHLWDDLTNPEKFLSLLN